jgi:hypothetical protein
LSRVGRLLYRRPLTAAEVHDVVDTAGAASTQLGSFYGGLSLALAAMLENPKFLFVIEESEPDPAHAGGLRLTSYSLATRLSLMLWNTTPDDALLAAAARGDLYRPAILANIVDGMIASPRLEEGVRAFFSDMFAFEDFTNLAKDSAIYPAFTQRSADDAQEQMLKTIVYHVIDRNADYRDLFTTRTTFLSPSLAPLYGLPAARATWARYVVPASDMHVGLLTQIGFLAAHSHPGRSSPTRRGRALRELILCEKIPDPPPNVDFSIVEDPHAKFHTARERLAAHRADPGCAGCHRLSDPMGLSLENFDGAGQFRRTENDTVIDASGDLDGATFKDPQGLGEAVRNDPGTPACIVNRMFSYSVGRRSARTDKPLLVYLNDRFAQRGYRVTSLLRAIATSRFITEVRRPAQTISLDGSNTGSKG